MKLHLVAPAALALALGLASGACNITSVEPPAAGGTGTSGGAVGVAGTLGSGGTGNTSGGSGGSAAASCSNVAPCGGNVVGTWKVASSCLSVSGSVDIAGLGLGCSMATASGSLQVTGSWTASADGSYIDNTTTTGTEQLELAANCLNISGTTTDCAGVTGPLEAVGYSSVSCTPSASGGCSCMASVNKMGGVGVVTADSPKSGNYKTGGNVITSDETRPYPYCVSGNTMTWTPQTATPITTGSIVFQSDSGSGGAGGSGGSGGTGGSDVGGAAGSGGSGGGATAPAEGPCDVYAAGNTPCAAAYSTIRRLSKAYTGPLYQVRNGSSSMNTGSGGMTKDIGVTADGFADTAAQDTFCAGSVCTFSLLYDQSGNKNNLKVAPKGLSNGGQYAAMDDFESSATKGSMMIRGHKVYSLYMAAREGYRLTAKGAGMPLGTASQGIYMLADGTHSGTACCWDFGNVSTDPTKYGVMNTLFFGTGFWGKGAGSGPWFLGDFEGGVWSGGSGGSNTTNNNNPALKVPFAFGILKTSPNHYAIRAANLQMAADLTTAYDGQSPKQWANDGGILIGIGGDNSNNSWGTFFEGAIVAGLPTNETDLAVMKNVQAVGYGK